MPTSPGLVNYSGITLIGTYIVARMYRILNFENKWKSLPVMVSFVLLLILSSIGLCEYQSPVAAGLACCVFYFVSKIKLNPCVARIVFFVAPSMFSVYIISVGGGWGIIKYFVLKLESLSLVFAALVAGLAVFLFSLFVDQPRRILTWMTNKPIITTLNTLDEWYFKAMRTMDTLVRL